MFKFLGTLAFLFFIYCLVMLIISLFNRRINAKLWIVCGVVSLLVLIVSYYVDVSTDSYREKFDGMVQHYSE